MNNDDQPERGPDQVICPPGIVASPVTQPERGPDQIICPPGIAASPVTQIEATEAQEEKEEEPRHVRPRRVPFRDPYGKWRWPDGALMNRQDRRRLKPDGGNR